MYGLEQIDIAVPRDRSVSPHATGMSYGPERKMTEDQNTSISSLRKRLVEYAWWPREKEDQ